MGYQELEGKWSIFYQILKAKGVGLAYFFGSQKKLGPVLLDGQQVTGVKGSDLDLGLVLVEHPWDNRVGEEQRRDLQAALAPLFQPVPLHVLLLEEENAHVQYAAIRGIPAYVPDEEFAREYRRRVLTLYGDWHSWW